VTRTGFYAGLGFISFMAGLFFWTLTNEVLWAALGAIGLLICFARSDDTNGDNER
jgi:hypothetical protein